MAPFLLLPASGSIARSLFNGGGSVKKLFLTTAALLTAVTLSAVGLAAGSKITGVVVKTEGEFVEIKAADGSVHKFHVDKTTRQTGDIKQGSQVEVEATPQGHASAISVQGK